MKISGLQQRCEVLCKALLLPENFQTTVADIYLPLAGMMLEKISSSPLLVSINGAQGTGKSTMTRFLKLILETEFGLDVATLSLDDFYLSRKERLQISKDIHPLLETRGVPGTHDVDLLESVLGSLLDRQSCTIPVFDKATDDRLDMSLWCTQDKAVDIILFEGWCNNSPVQSPDELQEPINALEEKEDSEGVWRHYVNQCLADYHQRLFDLTDVSVMLKAPDYNSVYRWRCLQEEKLGASNSGLDECFVMDEQQIKRFLQFFERISRHSLIHLPQTADVVMPMMRDHSITGIMIKAGRQP